MDNYDHLKLENQLCFPFYAASRLITRLYQPHLDKLGITYPQYLVLLILWEKDELSVNEIASKLILNTNTVTPLLKRLQSMNLLQRKRSEKDERKVMIRLTQKGKNLKDSAAHIPGELLSNLKGTNMNQESIVELRGGVNDLINSITKL